MTDSPSAGGKAAHSWHSKHERKHRSKNIRHKGPDCAYDRLYELSHIGPGDTAWVDGGPFPVTEGCGWGCPDCAWVCGGRLQFLPTREAQ